MEQGKHPTGSRATAVVLGVAALLAAAAPGAPTQALSLALPVCADVTLLDPTTLYCNNFDLVTGPTWTPFRLFPAIAPAGEHFLGEFGNDVVTLTLATLPVPHVLTLEFDLYVIRSWDGSGSPGPDVWRVGLEGQPPLVRTTFSNCHQPQAFPGPFPGAAFPPVTGAAALNTLGYDQPCAPGAATDAVYHFALETPATGPLLRIVFAGEGLQVLGDESWGLDNVKVGVRLP